MFVIDFKSLGGMILVGKVVDKGVKDNFNMVAVGLEC